MFTFFKLIFWPFVAMMAFSNFLRTGEPAGLIIFLVLVPLIAIRYAVTIGKGIIEFWKGMIKVF